MSTFVLVHGGWAGGWVWEQVAPALREHGHHVVAPDLPGHGEDRTPLSEITLDSYVDRVAAALDAAPQPAILVGHSSGGVVITQAAERRPEQVRRLVYVSAYLPGDGQTLFELGQTDTEQLVLPNLVVAPDGGSARVKPEAVPEALFADCPEAVESYLARITDEPLAPVATPVKLTAERYGALPKAYLECLRDRGISLALQRRMHTAAAVDTVIAMDTGHMPMYAAPGRLASHLHALGAA